MLLIAAAGLAWLWPGSRNPVEPAPDPVRLEQVETTLPVPGPWSGDLDGMLERRLVRILVPYSKTLYFLDQGRERGIAYDVGMELQKWLNRKHGSKTLPIRVLFIPTSRQFLLQDLAEGLGDIAAGNLTITPERLKLCDFTNPAAGSVDEIIVTGPASPVLESLADLEKIPLYVRTTSSYYEHLTRFAEDQRLSLNLLPVDESLEDEDLLEMVNAGLLPMAIVDNHKAAFWTQIFKDIKLREDLAINRGGKIAWAIRKGSPKLLAELNAFGKVEATGKGLVNMLLKRYLVSTRYVDKATDKAELAKFDALQGLFRKYAEMYDLDALLLLAQGYQESRLDQSVRSRAGAVGIMQILPSTAAFDKVQIENVETDLEQNIHAGAKYMRHLLATYLSDPGLDRTNRLLLGLAAYNAGPSNLRRMRSKAGSMGLDQNVWFNNVEHAAAQVIGRETVQYVSNIYKYYLAYRLVEEQRKPAL